MSECLERVWNVTGDVAMQEGLAQREERQISNGESASIDARHGDSERELYILPT